MKALTVKQGWASLMFLENNPKDIENRSWPTSYRGDLIIHAGQSENSIRQSLVYCQNLKIEVVFPERLLLGALLGIVELVDCTRDSTSHWAMNGYWHWVLANPRPFLEPIPMKGALKFWETGLTDRDIAERMRNAPR